MARNTEISGENNTIGFRFYDATIMFADGRIEVYRNSKICGRYEVEEFVRRPNAISRRMQRDLQSYYHFGLWGST